MRFPSLTFFAFKIFLSFGVHTRSWPGINLQPLEYNFGSYFWRFRGGGGGVLLSVSKESESWLSM